MKVELTKPFFGRNAGEVIEVNGIQLELLEKRNAYKAIPITSKKVESTQRKRKKKVDPGMGERKTK